MQYTVHRYCTGSSTRNRVDTIIHSVQVGNGYSYVLVPVGLSTVQPYSTSRDTNSSSYSLLFTRTQYVRVYTVIICSIFPPTIGNSDSVSLRPCIDSIFIPLAAICDDAIDDGVRRLGHAVEEPGRAPGNQVIEGEGVLDGSALGSEAGAFPM